MTSTHVIDVTDEAGRIASLEWLEKAEAVHRQLRPQLPEHYVDKMRRVFAGGGRMAIAAEDGVVVGVAVFRIYENTVYGPHMYVDDLVTDDGRRSTGVGKALLAHLQDVAKRAGCKSFDLDSGTQRQQAHKFYFREGLLITGFHFGKSL